MTLKVKLESGVDDDVDKIRYEDRSFCRWPGHHRYAVKRYISATTHHTSLSVNLKQDSQSPGFNLKLERAFPGHGRKLSWRRWKVAERQGQTRQVF